jgi:hypothetical protein
MPPIAVVAMPKTVVPIIVVIVDVVVAILPVFARLVAVVLPVFTILIAKLVSRGKSILQVVAPLLRIGWSLSVTPTGPFAIAEAGSAAIATRSVSKAR